MKILAVSTNLSDPTPYLAEEMQKMSELQRSGVVERLLLKADRSGAVLVLEAPDPEAARSAVGTLPLAQHGVTEFTFTTLIDPAVELARLDQPS